MATAGAWRRSAHLHQTILLRSQNRGSLNLILDSLFLLFILCFLVDNKERMQELRQQLQQADADVLLWGLSPCTPCIFILESASVLQRLASLWLVVA